MHWHAMKNQSPHPLSKIAIDLIVDSTYHPDGLNHSRRILTIQYCTAINNTTRTISKFDATVQRVKNLTMSDRHILSLIHISEPTRRS